MRMEYYGVIAERENLYKTRAERVAYKCLVLFIDISIIQVPF